LKPSLIKSYNSLIKGGHLILYINTPKYIQNELDKLNKIMKYRGVIYAFDKNSAKKVFRNIYVWQKMDSGLISGL
jgi:hypothetical protein